MAHAHTTSSPDPFDTLIRARAVANRAQKWNRDNELALAARGDTATAGQRLMRGALPNLPAANSVERMSQADIAQLPRKLGGPLTLPSRGLPGGGTPDSAGPRTVQNTGRVGISASTPGAGARMSAKPALDTSNLPVTTLPNGTRTVQIDKKYQTPAADIGKGEIVGSGKAPYSNVGTASDPWASIADDKKYGGILDPKHEDFGTHNPAFVDAWKTHMAENKLAPGTKPSPEEFRSIADKVIGKAQSDATASNQYAAQQAPLDAAMVDPTAGLATEAAGRTARAQAAVNAASPAYRGAARVVKAVGDSFTPALTGLKAVGQTVVDAGTGVRNAVRGAYDAATGAIPTAPAAEPLPGVPTQLADDTKKKKLDELPY